MTAYLDGRRDTARFGEIRVFRPTIVPAQNDGFMISLALSIFERALGPRFDPSRLVIVVCDPTALPDRFKLFQVLRGDRMGFRMQFPSEWLALPLDYSTASSGEGKRDDGMTAPDFFAGFRSLLRQHIGTGGLSAETAAALVAMSRWKLARQLASHGTDISAELARAKWDFAQDRLIHSGQSIEEISAALGYSGPANFPRAFAREKGQSPSKFRRTRRLQAT